MSKIRWIEKNRTRIVLWTVLGILVLSVGSLLITQVADFVTRGEIDSRIVGVKFGSAEPDQNVLQYDYLDRSTNPNEMRTASYSEKYPDQYITNWGKKQLSNGEWFLDPDNDMLGSPNMRATIWSDVKPCDSQGNTRSEYEGTEYARTFVNEKNEEYDVLIYETYFKTGITIEVSADKNPKIYTYLWVDYLDSGYTAEAWGEYNSPRKGGPFTFAAKKTDFRFVFEVSILNFEFGDLGLVHAEEYDHYHNAIIDARITSAVDDSFDTSGWNFGSNIGYMANNPELDLYGSAEDCLKQRQTIPRQDAETIDTDNIWHNKAYFGIDGSALLGTKFPVGSGMAHWAKPPVDTGNYFVTYEVAFTALTSFSKPVGQNENPDPPEPPEPPGDDGGFNLFDFVLDMFTKLFNNPKDMDWKQWLVLIVGIIVGIVLFVVFLPYIIQGVVWLVKKLFQGIGQGIRRSIR